MKRELRAATPAIVAIGIAMTLGTLGAGWAVATHVRNPMNWSCQYVVESPIHAGRAAANSVNEFLGTSADWDSYFAVLAMCRAEPGVDVAQVAEDLKDGDNGTGWKIGAGN